MPFPTTPILDDFNRGTGLGANWTQSPIAANPLAISSNQAASSLNDYGTDYWNPTQFSGDVEGYFTIPTISTNNNDETTIDIMTDTSANVDGYQFDLLTQTAGTDHLDLYRMDNGVFTQLGSSGLQEVSAGDAIGGARISGFVQFWYKAAAGAWAMSFQQADSTYTGPANIGITIRRSVTRVDDFGGGLAVTSVFPAMLMQIQGAGGMIGRACRGVYG